MSEAETTPVSTAISYGWRHIYSFYRDLPKHRYQDPPKHRYQAIEIVERAETGALLIKVYGGRGDGSWMELVVPKEERDRIADAIRTDSEAQS